MSNIPEWVTINRSAKYPKWELTELNFYPAKDDPDYPNECNNDTTNVYCRTLAPNSSYMQGITVFQVFPSDKALKVTQPEGTLQYCGENYGCDFFMSGDSSFNPERGEAGPYTFFVLDRSASDIVSGLGLRLRHHEQYTLTWQFKNSPDNPEPPDPEPEPTTGEWVIKNQRKATATKPARIVLEFKE